MKLVDKIAAYVSVWIAIFLLIALSMFLGYRWGVEDGYSDALWEENEYVCDIQA
jgi:hypothetical protein